MYMTSHYLLLPTRKGRSKINEHYFISYIQGVSENMQQLFTSTKIGCKPGQIKFIYQTQAYIQTMLLIIKNPENDTK